MSSELGDEWQLRYVRIPKGTHLSDSTATEGAARDLLRENGTNRLLGPPESMSADDDSVTGRGRSDHDSPDSGTSSEPSLGVALATAGVLFLAAKYGPAAVEKARKALRPATGKVRSRMRPALHQAEDTLRAELVVPAPPAPGPAREIASPAVHEPPVRMSSAEYRERAKAAITADAYAGWQRQILSNAVIDDGETSPQMLSAVRLVLEGRGSLLGEAEMAAVIEYLRGPSTTESVKMLEGPALGAKELEPPLADWIHRPPLRSPPAPR